MGKDKASKNNRIHANLNTEYSREFSAQATNNGKQKYQDTPNHQNAGKQQGFLVASQNMLAVFSAYTLLLFIRILFFTCISSGSHS